MSSTANQNFGTNNDTTAISRNLIVGNPGLSWTNFQSTAILSAFLQFSLASIPSNATITAATLILTRSQSENATPRTVNLHAVTSAWTETGVTWTNQPSRATSSILSFAHNQSCPASRCSFSITSTVQAWHATPSSNRGFVLYSPEAVTNPTFSVGFRSRESQNLASAHPRLVVTYILPTGLVAHWRLDGNATDSTAFANNGTLVGGVTPTTDRFGNASGALQFDGSTGGMRVPVRTSLATPHAGPMTASLWFKPTSLSGSGGNAILFSAGVNVVGWSLQIRPDGRLFAGLCVPLPGCVSAVAVNPLTINRWYHAAARISGGVVTLFVDGVPVRSVGYSANGNSVDSTLSIGTSTIVDPRYFFTGAVDDARVYRVALSDTQIAALSADRPCTWCDVLVTFDGDSVPAGWEVGTFGAAPGAIRNGRMEAFATDRGIAIRSQGSVPPVGTLAVEIVSRGPLSDIGSGMQRNAFVQTGGTAVESSVITFLSGGPPAGAPNQLVIGATQYSSYSFPSNGVAAAFTNATLSYSSGDELQITRVFRDDSLIVTVRRAADSTLLGRVRLGLPGFRVADARGVVYYLKYSTGGAIPAILADDIQVRALAFIPSEAAGPATLSIVPPSMRVDVGRSNPLATEVFDAGGNSLSFASLTWTSRAPTIATVTQTGNLTSQVTGVSTGTTWIVAEDGAARDSTLVTVGADAIVFTLGQSGATVLGVGRTLAAPLGADFAQASGRSLLRYALRMEWDVATLSVDSIVTALGIATLDGTDRANGILRFIVSLGGPISTNTTLATAFIRGVGDGLPSTVQIFVTAAADANEDPLAQIITTRGIDICTAWAVGLWGDMDDDGVLDARDVQQLYRFASGLLVARPQRYAAVGDVDENGSVNAADAEAVARAVAGLAGFGRAGTGVSLACP